MHGHVHFQLCVYIWRSCMQVFELTPYISIYNVFYNCSCLCFSARLTLSVWLICLVHMCAGFTSSFSHCHWAAPPLWPPGYCRPGSKGWPQSTAEWRSRRRAGGRIWPTPAWLGEESECSDHPWQDSLQLWHWSGPGGEQFLGINVFLLSQAILLQHNGPVFTLA